MNIETASFLSIKSKLDTFGAKRSSVPDNFVSKGFGVTNKYTKLNTKRRHGMILPDKLNHESLPRMGYIVDEEVLSSDSFFKQDENKKSK